MVIASQQLGGMTVVDARQGEWISGLDVLPTMPVDFRSHLGPEDQLETMLSNYWSKPLLYDPDTTRRVDLVNLQPGYCDLTSAYHESTEECFAINGECMLNGEEHVLGGDYFWRPPGWVHSAFSTDGFTALLMMEGVSPADGSGRATRVMRPDDECGTNALFDDPEQAVGPRGWVRRQERALLPWIEGSDFFGAEVAGGDATEAVTVDLIRVRVLSKNHQSGAQSLQVQLRPGFRRQRCVPAATQYMFVLDGAILVDGHQLPEGNFVVQHEGAELSEIEAPQGAELFVKTNRWWRASAL